MASPKRTRLYKPAPSTSNDSGLDIWSQAVAPYLSDPFRGNVERRVLGPGESSLTLEYRAAEDALNAAKLSPDEVELAIVASIFPEQLVPGNASYLARQLELRCPAWNLESTCSSALVALQNARALVQTGEYRNVLVVVSHIESHSVDEEDSLSWSMGDGAGAFVVDSLKPTQGVLANKIVHTAATCGAYLHELVTDAQGKPRMRTRTGENASTFAETSVEFVRTCCQGAIAAAGVTLDQIDFFAFNTPTAWYADVCTRALGINPERTINLYPQYANIGSVLPIANLYHAALAGKIRENDLVLVYTNGAAATAAATVMRWGDVTLGPVPAPPIHVTHEEDRIHPAQPGSISTDILHHSQELPVGCVRRSRNAPLSSDSVGYAAANPPYKLLIENGARSESTEKLLTAQKASLSREKLLAASPEKRQEILQTYLLEWLANSLQLPLAQLNPQQSLASFVDSLMAFEFRSRIEVDLQVRVSIERFFGDNNITQLAELLLNQLVLTSLIPSESISVADVNEEEREILSL